MHHAITEIPPSQSQNQPHGNRDPIPPAQVVMRPPEQRVVMMMPLRHRPAATPRAAAVGSGNEGCQIAGVTVKRGGNLLKIVTPLVFPPAKFPSFAKIPESRLNLATFPDELCRKLRFRSQSALVPRRRPGGGSRRRRGPVP